MLQQANGPLVLNHMSTTHCAPKTLTSDVDTGDKPLSARIRLWTQSFIVPLNELHPQTSNDFLKGKQCILQDNFALSKCLFFDAHPIAQPWRHTTSKAFQALQWLCDIYTILNFESCKCVRMRYHCANDLAGLRICAPLGDTEGKGVKIYSQYCISEAPVLAMLKMQKPRLPALHSPKLVECVVPQAQLEELCVLQCIFNANAVQISVKVQICL